MADPTPLSPAAQAVLSAFGYYPLRASHIAEDLIPALAAALRAAVGLVISSVPPPCEDFDEYAQGFLAAHIKYRDELLAIAAELEGKQ